MYEYSFSDFGKRQYRDIVDPVTILTILIAFTIPLFSKGFTSSNIDIGVSYISGAIALIFFMLYMVDYYEKIWLDYYSLPTDISFFRIYCLVVGVIVISLMDSYPIWWSCYMSALFLVMSIKKYSTRRLYESALEKEFGKELNGLDQKYVCAYFLAQNMSTNFFVLGFLVSVFVSLVLAAAFVSNNNI